MNKRAVITGIGVVAPNGIGTSTWWEATKEGTSGIKPIQRFDPSKYDTQVAGEVEGFEPTDYIEQRMIVQTDRWTWMALAATQMALEDANFDPSTHEPYKMSVITASSSGGNEFGQKEIQNLWGKGPIFVGAYQSIAWFYAATTGQISIKHGMKGASGVIIAEQAGGLEALQHSRRTINRGVDFVVSGGTEGPIGPYALTCQLTNRLLSKEKDPAKAYRPFHPSADGYVPGEGGAILIVEDLEFARQRGAPRIYGEIAGYAATNDAYHYSKPAPDGRQFARAISLALQNAGIGPEDVDVIFADAAGTPEQDALEVKAIKEVFGDGASSVPVTAPKSMVGRLYGGGAPLDVAAALLTMRDGCIPPTIGLDAAGSDERDQSGGGYGLNFVAGKAQETPVKTALINARGFGGFNSALVLKSYEQ